MQQIAILKRHLGMSISAFMHLLLFVLMLVNFPQCHRQAPLDIIIAVDLLPIAKVSNVENKQAAKPEKEEPPIEKPKPIKEEPKPEPVDEKPIQKEESAKPAEEIKPIKEEPKPDPILEPKKEEPKKIENKEKPKPKPEPKKDNKKTKPAKPVLSEYDKLLKDLQDIEKKNDLHQEVADKPSRGPHDSSKSLSLSVKDSIRMQVEKCWSPPAGNKDASRLQILLRISLKQDGSVASVKVVDNMRYNSDELYRVAADAAVRAVYKASPLQGLPLDQYNIWQDLEFDFNPIGILGD